MKHFSILLLMAVLSSASLPAQRVVMEETVAPIDTVGRMSNSIGLYAAQGVWVDPTSNLTVHRRPTDLVQLGFRMRKGLGRRLGIVGELAWQSLNIKTFDAKKDPSLPTNISKARYYFQTLHGAALLRVAFGRHFSKYRWGLELGPALGLIAGSGRFTRETGNFSGAASSSEARIRVAQQYADSRFFFGAKAGLTYRRLGVYAHYRLSDWLVQPSPRFAIGLQLNLN